MNNLAFLLVRLDSQLLPKLVIRNLFVARLLGTKGSKSHRRRKLLQVQLPHLSWPLGAPVFPEGLSCSKMATVPGLASLQFCCGQGTQLPLPTALLFISLVPTVCQALF